MKRVTALLLIQIFFLAGWVAGQGEPLQPAQIDQAKIVLPEPPFDGECGVVITIRGTSGEPGQKATLLAVHNLHQRITFEIEVSRAGTDVGSGALRPWAVSAGLGYLEPGTYQIVAVVNGRVVDEKPLGIFEPSEDTGEWIVYTKSGGIAGIYRRLRVDLETRRYELTDDGRQYKGTLPLRNHLRLEAALLLCDFRRLKPEYRPPTPVADGFRYEVQVPGYIVVGYSGAEVPYGLSYLIRTLDDLVEDILKAQLLTPTPRVSRPTPTPRRARPTPTVTPVPPTPTPTPGGAAVTGRITVYAESPTANGRIPAVIDLRTPTGSYRVVSSTVRREGGNHFTVSLSVVPLRPGPFWKTEDTPIRTFVDLGVPEPGEYDVVLVINDVKVDRATFAVQEPGPPFLWVRMVSAKGEPWLSLEISRYGRFVVSAPDGPEDGTPLRGRLYSGEMEEIEQVLKALPLVPVPPEGPPDPGPGDTLVVHGDQMLLIPSELLIRSDIPPSPELVAVITLLEEFVAELRSRVQSVESFNTRLTILPEMGWGEDSSTFDVAGEFASSNYEVVWGEASVVEDWNIRLDIWAEAVAPVGAMVITPWRVQLPAPDLRSGMYFVSASLNRQQMDVGLFSIISVGGRQMIQWGEDPNVSGGDVEGRAGMNVLDGSLDR